MEVWKELIKSLDRPEDNKLKSPDFFAWPTDGFWSVSTSEKIDLGIFSNQEKIRAEVKRFCLMKNYSRQYPAYISWNDKDDTEGFIWW